MKTVTVEASIYNVEVDVDPAEVLDQLDPSDIEDYLEDKPYNLQSKSKGWDYDMLVESYYHGDFDLKKLLEELKMSDLVALFETKKFCRP
jgi:hypothetical protein